MEPHEEEPQKDQENNEQPQAAKAGLISRRVWIRALLVIFCCLAVAAAVYSPLLAMGTVVVNGNQQISSPEICEIAGAKGTVNVFRLTTSDMQQKLSKDLRIEKVSVRRTSLSTVEIQITERVELASVACEYGFLDLGKQGIVLDAYRNLKKMQVPMITGTTAHNLYIGDTMEDPAVAQILEFLACLDDASLRQLSEIHIAGPNRMVAYTTGAVQIRLGDFERLEEKAQLTQGFLRELKTAKYPIEYIDFNYSSPFIKFKK